MKVLIALDIGSSSLRCSAYELLEDSNAVEALDGCSTQTKFRSIRPTTGRIALLLNQKAEGDDGSSSSSSLLDEIDRCVDECLKALREKHQEDGFSIVGLGFSTFVMNLVGVDENGQPVDEQATLSYACNAPLVAQECRNMKSDIGPERRRQLYQSTGAPFHSAYALPQLRSLYKNNNVLTQSIVKWQTLSAIILNRWQGQTKNFRPISYSEASWTGLLNVRSCEWDRDALLLLPDDCQVALPDLCDFNEQTVVGITETMAEPNTGESNPYHARWPELRESCRFFGGLGDGVCANIGSKCSSPSRIAVTIGTSAAARVILPLEQSLTAESSIDEGFTVPSGLWCYRLDRSHIVLGGALTDGGSIVEWAQSFLNLKGDAFAECMKQVEGMMDDETKTEEVASSSTTTRVTVIPFLSGERSTGYRDGANCCVMGLTRETTPSMFLKACLEGVMLRVNAVVQLVKGSIAVMDDREDGQQPPYLVVSGAALERNEHWRQMLADVSGMEVKLDHNGSEGTSRGVARMIAIALFAATEQRDEEEQDEEEEEEENESNEMKEDSPLLLLEDEEIVSPTVSTPRLEATDGYWARAAKDQKDFIDAVSPLW